MKYGGETGAVRQLAKEAWTAYMQETGNICTVKGFFEEDFDQPEAVAQPGQPQGIPAAPMPQTTTARRKRQPGKLVAATTSTETPLPATPLSQPPLPGDLDQVCLADLASVLQPETNRGRGRGANRARGRGRSLIEKRTSRKKGQTSHISQDSDNESSSSSSTSSDSSSSSRTDE